MLLGAPGDSLGVPGSEGETYIGSIVHNINTLVSAWDVAGLEVKVLTAASEAVSCEPA